MKANTSQNTFMHHLTSPLFILVALFLSFLLLSISYLPIIWFPWLMYLTKGDLKRSKLSSQWLLLSMSDIFVFTGTDYTFMYNMSAASGLIIAPICGLLVDYKIARGEFNRIVCVSPMVVFWVLCRLSTETVEYLHSAEFDLDFHSDSLHCLHVSIRQCRVDGHGDHALFTCYAGCW